MMPLSLFLFLFLFLSLSLSFSLIAVAVNLVRQFPAGIQLLNTLWSADAAGASSDSSSAISSLPGLVDGAVLFVWNGRDVKGVVVPEDAFIEPVLLEIKTQRIDTLGSPYQVRAWGTYLKNKNYQRLPP